MKVIGIVTTMFNLFADAFPQKSKTEDKLLKLVKNLLYLNYYYRSFYFYR